MKQLILLSCLALALLCSPAFAWASFNGGNHLQIDQAAYGKLSSEAGFDAKYFPSISKISAFTGMLNGADANPNPYEDYKYSNHYYNPGNGQGNAQYRAQYWYGVLVDKIKNGKANTDQAAQAAAFLGHYIADVGSPYHVEGEIISNPSPAYKDWYDKYYEEAPYYHAVWEGIADTYSTYNSYPGTTPEWNSGLKGSSQIVGFVKEVAGRTKEDRAKWWSTVSPEVREPLGYSVQDVYTVFKAAYEEGRSGAKMAQPSPLTASLSGEGLMFGFGLGHIVTVFAVVCLGLLLYVDVFLRHEQPALIGGLLKQTKRSMKKFNGKGKKKPVRKFRKRK